MKTIQQIIKEMDPIDIVKAYYAEYPIRLFRTVSEVSKEAL